MEPLRASSSSETVAEVTKKPLKYNKDYYSVSEDEQSDYQLLDEKRLALSKRHTIWKPLVTALGFCFVVAILLAVIGSQHQKLSKISSLPAAPTGRELGDCGSDETAESARAAGCKFDPMSWIWVRPECYPEDLIYDYFNRTGFKFYKDWHLRPEDEIPMDQVYYGTDMQVYTEKNFHAVHCSYMWRKMHAAMVGRLPIDSDLSNWHHTIHCESIHLNEIFHEDVDCSPEMICPTQLIPLWTSCGYF